MTSVVLTVEVELHITLPEDPGDETFESRLREQLDEYVEELADSILEERRRMIIN